MQAIGEVIHRHPSVRVFVTSNKKWVVDHLEARFSGHVIRFVPREGQLRMAGCPADVTPDSFDPGMRGSRCSECHSGVGSGFCLYQCLPEYHACPSVTLFTSRPVVRTDSS